MKLSGRLVGLLVVLTLVIAAFWTFLQVALDLGQVPTVLLITLSAFLTVPMLVRRVR